MSISIRAAMGALFLLVAGVSAAATPLPRTYVIVHGAFQDAGAWREVRAGLMKRGRRVIVVELPGRPGNPLPPEQATLDLYRDTVLKAIATTRGRVALVGHSFGGITISNVAEAVPERIATLVYVAAYLPRSGDTLQSLAAEDKTNGFGPGTFVVAPDFKTASILESDRAELFCADCPPALKAALPGQMLPEPLGPMGTPLVLTSARFGSVDKVYITTRADRAISPAMQDAMLARVPVRKVLRLEASHSPFLSQPDALVGALLDLR